MAQPEQCLRVCLLGDPGTGQSALLRAYRGDEGGQPAHVETMVTTVEMDEEQWLARFTDNLGDTRYDSMRSAALSSAHVILLCFSVDCETSLLRVRERWAPLVWSAGSEAPTFLLGTKADLREAEGGDPPCIPEEAGVRAAHQLGALGYLECSAVHPDTVMEAIDQALVAAREYYYFQWQLCPDPAWDESASPRMITAAPVSEEEMPEWLIHEKLNVHEDPRPLDEVLVKKGLSMLGRTPSRQHAYLKMDLVGQSITSVDAIRPYVHLQFVNVSDNQLRSLEPLCTLRSLLRLDASKNCLLRVESFTAPDALEVVDLSYNLIGDFGEWGVHKYLKELSLRGNFINRIGPGLLTNRQLRSLDLSENAITRIENLKGLHLRSLCLAQNQLTSLDGISSLEKLHVLNVRHNNITSVAALQATDVPRLKKLCLSENRISHISEVAGLNGFSFLCDLLLAPNPVVELPHYRAQVLHRLPRLRSVDGAPVPAEEKVKADLIYGVDVEARRSGFEELLPEESFVDRRLVTEEGIAHGELEHFGEQGHAGLYGAAAMGLHSEDSLDGRTRFQDAKFRQRLELTRSGGEPVGVADFSNFPAPFVNITARDEDLNQILEAALEGRVQHLMLGGALLTVAGVSEVVATLSFAPGALRHVDLSGCAAVGQMRQELMNIFPFDRGCSMEAVDCGLPPPDVERLRNQTAQAEDALQQQDAERQRTAAMIEEYFKKQEVLEDFAAENCTSDAPPPPPHLLCHPMRWRDGIQTEAKTAYAAFCASNPQGLGRAKTGGGGSGMFPASVVKPDGSHVDLGSDEGRVLENQRNNMLRDWGCIIEEYEGEYDEYDEGAGDCPEGSLSGRPLPAEYLEAFSDVLKSRHLMGFMLWAGVEVDQEALGELRRKREEWERAWRERQERFDKLSNASKQIYDAAPLFPGAGSGQLMAHFSFLSCGSPVLMGNEKLHPPNHFGLKRLSEKPRPAPSGHAGEDLHQLLAAGSVTITEATGTSFGQNSVTLSLQSQLAQDCQIVVRQGSIFQHVDWQHRQNLCVCMDYMILLPAGGIATKQLNAYCMNVTCSCSNGNPMSLTEFYFDDLAVLESQGLVWDHFEKSFGHEKP